MKRYQSSLKEFFDCKVSVNVFTSALYLVARAVNPSESDAKNWFEAMDVKFKICELWDTELYQALFSTSGV